MNRKMQKENRELSKEATLELLEKGQHATLSVNGDDGYPYGIPINYVYMDGYIYMHSAQYGYKMDAIKRDNKVSFTVTVNTKVIPDKFTAAFESIIAFGKVEIVEEKSERIKAMEKFLEVFSPGFEEKGKRFLEKAIDKTAVIKISIEEIKGKAYTAGGLK